MRQVISISDVLQTLFSIPASHFNFSVGEKQLFCLCRALLQNNDIILMDEPAASVDEISFSKLRKIITSAFSNKTVVLITHRLQALADFDTVYEMDEGKLRRLGENQQDSAIS